MLDKSSKIYVAGHKGLVGSAIWANLMSRGYTNLIGRTHAELDLMDPVAVREFFDREKPDAVVLAAAFVGGIMANLKLRADFIYPKMAPQPMAEDALLTSELEYTNEPYAIAKIAGLKMCESFSLQYGCNYIAVMPTNLYGPNDNFDLEKSHVLPAMIRKIHLAGALQRGDWDLVRKDLAARPVEGVGGEDSEAAILSVLGKYGIGPGKVTLWGTGNALREFLWSEDMADASVHVLLNVDFKDVADGPVNKDGIKEIRNCHINVGTGKEITIKELAALVAAATKYDGEILWDSSRPDGTHRKLTDVSKLNGLGWRHSVELEDGVSRLYEWYLASL